MRRLQGNSLANTLLQTQLRRLNTQAGGETEAGPAAATTAMVPIMANAMPSAESYNNTINIRLGLDPAIISQLSGFQNKDLPVRARNPELPYRQAAARDTRVVGSGTGSSQAPTTADGWLFEGTCTSPDWPPIPDLGFGLQSYENLRASMLHTVHPSNRKEGLVGSSKVHRVMTLANRPLTPGLLATPWGESNEA